MLASRMRCAVLLAACAFAATAIACGDVNDALSHLVEARRVASDLHVRFSQAVDASNRAVMASTDEASLGFAKEAQEETRLATGDVGTLRSILQGLNYTDELRLLGEFEKRFAAYGELDKQILDLAVQNTNIKAQQLSFGAAQTAAEAFRVALAGVAASDPARDRWHLEALAATAVGAVRQIQVLEAPHIADPEDGAMTRMEQQMAAAEAVARKSLQAIEPLESPMSRPGLAQARAALDEFVRINTNIIALSRQNTNVRSLALSLDEKRALVKPCEESLMALQSGLAKRGYSGTR